MQRLSAEDLAQLPLRADVALAARCARRAEPAYRPPAWVPDPERLVRAVRAAIRGAEDFATAGTAPNLTTVGAVHAAISDGGRSLFAAKAASYALYAALAGASDPAGRTANAALAVQA